MKRIIALLLCLCIILTGCQNKKGNDDSGNTTNENTNTQTSESTNDTESTSSDNVINPDITNTNNTNTDITNIDNINIDNTGAEDNNENTATQLLKLNEAWSLMQTAKLLQEDFEVPAYEAKVTHYTIADDLSNVENINQFEGFTKEQIKMLVKNGFIVLPGNGTQINYAYDNNEYNGIPNFITSDVVLHLYHQFYDKSLMGMEANYLYKDLDLMTEQMLWKSIQLETQLSDEELKKLQKKNIIYFLVARMLMLQTTDVAVEVDAELLDVAKQEYELAYAAKGIMKSPLLGVDVDYSQFTVRGHYTRSEELGKFFKTMMWFGYVPLEFVNDDKEIKYDNVIQSLLITFTTIADSKEICDAKLWSDIYQPTAQYVGLSDDVNVFMMNGLRSSVYGENEDPNIYNDEEYRNALTEAVKALPEPQIQGKVATSQPTGKQFRFMGQRYLLDSDILQTLMEPILRLVPTSLDVMGVLGSNVAEDLLFNVYKPQDNWPEYTDKYQKLKEEVSGYQSNYWEKNLYNGWLWSLQEEINEYDSNSGMPFFMTTKAWKYKSLNAALGSYTELKHDTVLYGKQSMAECGGPVATAKQQYVEPNVELYSKLLYLTDYTCTVLEDKGMLDNLMKSGADTYKAFLKLLIDCSIKELRNETLSEEEIRQLLWSGGTMENIMMQFLVGATGDGSAKDVSDMLVTDIATCGGSYLSLGTGYFDDIYAVVPYDGKLYLSRGVVYSFYEFLSPKRLTDEAWWELQRIRVVNSDYGSYTEFIEAPTDLPAQPQWISSFKSDTNDVIITPLEVLWGNLEE